MKLISQGHEDCVMRAISTVCAVLQLPQPKMPEPVKFHGNAWVVEQLIRCLPNREILVWCEPGTISDFAGITYMGTGFYRANDSRTTIDDTQHIIMYAFSSTGIDVCHMAVGYPPFGYPDIVLRFVAAVKLD